MKAFLCSGVAFGLFFHMAIGQVTSPVQSPARPFNLDIVAPVQLAGSDARSADFQANHVPSLMKFVNESLGERQALSEFNSMQLNPANLSLKTAADVRVYFLSEGTSSWNTLGVNLDGTGVTGGDPFLIFPNASTLDSLAGGDLPSQDRDNAVGRPVSVGPLETMRVPPAPLLAGDFVDFGTVDAGTKLDFFLIADGARQPRESGVWTADPRYNSDGMQHMVSFALQGSPYLLIGFEDARGGGNLDFNDLVFVVDVGSRNVHALANPEPAVILSLGLLAACVYFVRRRFGHSSAQA